MPSLEQVAVPENERHYGALPVEYRPDATLPEMFLETAVRCPDGIALLGEEGALRYGDLLLRAQNVTVRLRSLGIGLGDAVGIVGHPSFQTIAGLLGILLAGAAYVPLTPPAAGHASSQEEAAFLKRVHACGITPVLVDSSQESGQSRWGEPALRWVDLAATEREKMPLFAESKLPRLLPESAAALLESSAGEITTLTHGAITRLVSSPELFDLRGAQTLLLSAPLVDPGHVLALWGALLGGATLALAPVGPVGPDGLAHSLRQYRVTSLMLPMPPFAALAEKTPEIFRALSQLALYPEQPGGEPPDQNLLEAVLLEARDLRILYSSDVMDGAGYLAVEASVAASVKAETTPVSEEPAAEQQVSSPVEGWDESDATANPIREYGAEALEALLQEHSLVARCAVVPVSEAQALTCAYVALVEHNGHQGQELSTAARARVAGEQLWAYLAEHVPAEARPARIVVRPDLPLDDGGQPNRPLLQMEARNELRERRGPARVDRSTYQAYAGQVREIWVGLLHRSDIGLDDDFYAAGGTQVDMIRLHAETNRRFPGAVTMADLPVLRTVRTLVNHLLHSIGQDRRSAPATRSA